MFWRKRKTILNSLDSDSLFTLATRLSIEARQDARVEYPLHSTVCQLPGLSFQDCALRVLNISPGGCCVFDPKEILGPEVGNDVDLTVTWVTGDEQIKARVISRVDQQLHIRFLNLSSQRQTLLKRFMFPGLRGLSVRRNATGAVSGPQMSAVELWSSFQGDSVVLERRPQPLGKIYFKGDVYIAQNEGWPDKEKTSKACSRIELEQLILFLNNIPARSQSLQRLLVSLEEQLAKGVP